MTVRKFSIMPVMDDNPPPPAAKDEPAHIAKATNSNALLSKLDPKFFRGNAALFETLIANSHKKRPRRAKTSEKKQLTNNQTGLCPELIKFPLPS